MWSFGVETLEHRPEEKRPKSQTETPYPTLATTSKYIYSHLY